MENLFQSCDYKNVLHYFAQLSSVPRGSGFNDKISDYLVSFAREHGLSCVQDELKNVIIYKAATPGYEAHTPVIIQGHMDMVCVTEEGAEHNFEEEPLELFVEGDLIGARGTTLGGDDGIAIAYGLALLADDTLRHPALEIVITTDEETGMFGAKALDTNQLRGRYLINVDSEEEGVVLVSCAGGCRVFGSLPLKREEAAGTMLSIKLSGLLGGHSGAEIHKYRTNAVYLMARLLFDLKKEQDYFLVSCSGGEKENAIPCSCTAAILVSEENAEKTQEFLWQLITACTKELEAREPGMKFELFGSEGVSAEVLHPFSAEKLLFLLMQAPNGVQMMSSEINGLVESSLNLGVFELVQEQAEFHYSVRSSVKSYRQFLCDKLIYLFEFLGGECEISSEYPAWEYKKNSPLRDRFVEVFEEFYGKKPEIQAIHAGLECGLICEKVPDMDIVSIGPDMKDIHTPKERLSISSSIRVYRFLEKLLESFEQE